MTTRGREVEATLRVAGGDRGRAAAAVADQGAIAGRRLRAGGTVVLEDRYYDTAGRALGAAGLALRLRRRDGEWLLAVKGDERRLPGGATRRLEMEGAWSAGAVAEVRRLLAARGIELPGGDPEAPDAVGDGPEAPADGRGPADPAAAFSDLGLSVIQHRRTRRRRRLIAPPLDDAGGPAGELAVDRVGYRLRAGPPRRVVHREVEVEGRGPDAEAVVADVARALRREFGDALRRWDHNKLATGEALERLAERGELAALVGPEGELAERGYARLEAVLGEETG